VFFAQTAEFSRCLYEQCLEQSFVVLVTFFFNQLLCRSFPLSASSAVLQDVMNKLRSDNILDMNLEKSRAKELVSAGEK